MIFTSENIWVGESYPKSKHRILILAESDYYEATGVNLPLLSYVPTWINKKTKDYTFSRIFNACSEEDKNKELVERRRIFWDSIVYYNFLTVVLKNRKARPTVKQYEDSKSAFNKVLATHKPKGVWILGVGQAEFSRPIVVENRVHCVVQKHPTSWGLKKDVLRKSFLELQALCEDTSLKNS